MLYINCDKNEGSAFTKGDFLLYVAEKLGRDDIVTCGGDDPMDYVLNIEPYSKFRIGKKWTGIWEIDLLMDRVEMREENWKAADTIFTAITNVPNRFVQFKDKTELLFQACEPDFHKYNKDVKKDYDFILAGSTTLFIYKERDRLIKELIDVGFNYAYFGRGLSPRDYGKILNRARVQFIRSMKTGLSDGEIAQRFFECLAIGPVLTNYVKDLEKTGLIENEDYLAYRNDEELFEKMRKLIDNPDLAKQIAESGRNKALKHHTYKNRLNTIFEVIKEYKYKKT